MPHADDSPFAKRMMERPQSESLNTDVNARFFYDPPELIQIAFGGRAWFFRMGNSRAHRIGVFKGLGWELDPFIAKADERGITGVRITARPHHAASGKQQLYDMEFVGRRIDYDEAGFQDGFEQRTIDHRPGLEAGQLKAAYADVLGEHAV